MEIVVTLGKLYDAPDLVAIESAHISGVSYKNLGEGGLNLLRQWAGDGARVRVPSWLNPMGMEEARWREMGVPSAFASKQLEVNRAFEQIGVQPIMSCTPYLIVPRLPAIGSHLAWAESSAVVFANSVLGARSNREGGPSALASAVAGCTARYGYHLDDNRKASLSIHVDCELSTVADFGALGALVGRAVGDGVPYFHDLAEQLPPVSRDLDHAGVAVDKLKALGSAMAAYGSVALFHIADYTPEARMLGGALLSSTGQVLRVSDLTDASASLNHGQTHRIDLVNIGCPHASISEISQIARRLSGKKLATRLWVTTARATRDKAVDLGLVDAIEAAGGLVVADTCTVVAPLRDMGIRSVATNAAKATCYLPAHSGAAVRFGTLNACLDAALSGFWQE
jgi:predicted aconitase